MKNIISEVIVAKKINQGKIAAATGLDRGYLSKIISGKITPTLPTAFKLAKALEMRVEDIFLSE